MKTVQPRSVDQHRSGKDTNDKSLREIVNEFDLCFGVFFILRKLGFIIFLVFLVDFVDPEQELVPEHHACDDEDADHVCDQVEDLNQSPGGGPPAHERVILSRYVFLFI